MKQELSILIPTYNDVCTPLVRELQQQANDIGGLHFEILVADDGSTDTDAIEANRAIDQLDNCHYLMRKANSGRAAIRNFLAQQAQYRWLLFIDGDMTLKSSDFIRKYLDTESDEVVYGGYTVGNGSAENLRYRYEKEAEPLHTAEARQQRPYQDFHTANFMILRETMLAQPFDERFRYYGYEDVLFGKRLRQQHIGIRHIDNPVCFDTFEPNGDFLNKTEEGLRTLCLFSNELRGYNSLLTFVNGIHLGGVRTAIRLWHRLFAALERKQLTGRNPNLTVFKIYKLGYFLSLTKNK